MNEELRGGCLCGAVRYAIAGQPLARSSCHCRSCRLGAGASPVAWIVVNAGDFAFTLGEPKRYESSPGVERTFCGTCGTSFTYRRLDEPATIDVTTCTLDAPDAFAPTKEIWLEDRVAWAQVSPDLPHFPRTSRAVPAAKESP